MQEGDERTVQEIFEDINSLDPLQSDFDPIQIEVERHVQSSGYMSPDPISMVEVQDAWDLFQSCVGQIHSACVAHTLSQSRNAMLTEQELLIGTIVAKSSQPRKRKDTMAKVFSLPWFRGVSC
jgi:RNA-dependent RNA polymerase